MTETLNKQTLKQFLKDDAKRLGFSAMRITNAETDESDKTLEQNLRQFITNDYQGDMNWLKDTLERRISPKKLWPEVKSVIMLSMNYGPDCSPLSNLSRPDIANISVYARHKDYHDVIKGRLKEMAARFAAKSNAAVKVFVDTAPIMEKPLAQKAGLGWQGKHTNLVSRQEGSWFFLASIFTEAELDYDHRETDHCGSCTACIKACPTNAFPAPYKIDARRCISYLTIEHKGPIEEEFRSKIGNRIYGCDDCLAACPWNKYASQAREIKFQARDELIAPDIETFLQFDDQQFRNFFSKSPIKRIGRNRFMRNVLIAAGNSGKARLAIHCKTHLYERDNIVRGAAIWALSKLLAQDEMRSIYKEFAKDKDLYTGREWQRALAPKQDDN